MTDLIARVQLAYDKCKLFPERDPAGMIALLELRNLMPEVLAELARAASSKPQRGGDEAPR